MSSKLFLNFFITTLPIILAIHPESNQFYPKYLRSLVDCRLFGKSYLVYARAHAYFDGGQFFFNKDRKTAPLTKCAEELGPQVVFKYIFYQVMDTDFKNESFGLLKGINSVANNSANNVELVPHILLALGPNGKRKQLAHGLDLLDLHSKFMFGLAEQEQLHRGYSQMVFNNIIKHPWNYTSEIFIHLNGWHMRNMRSMAYFPKELLRLIVGLIVYVERENCHRISTHDATKHLPDVESLIILDLKCSPEFIDNGGEHLWRIQFSLCLATIINLVIIFVYVLLLH